MKLSKKGFDLINKYETGGNIKKYLNAYLDPVGIPTIGIGTTFYENGVKVKLGDKISEQRAIELFYNNIKQFENGVNRLVKVPINQNQFDALVSLAYNIGVGALTSSTVLRLINAKDTKQRVSDAWKLWNKGTISGAKTVLAGLVRRRNEEIDVFFSEDSPKKKAVTFAVIVVIVLLISVFLKTQNI